MNVLFVVCGEGLGHASRSVKLANYIKEQGVNCSFATYGKAYSFIQDRTDCPVYELSREVMLGGTGGYFSIGKTIAGIPVSLVKSFLTAWKILRREDIDVVVCDTMFAAGAAAKILQIPVLFMTNQNYFGSLTNPNAWYWKIFGKVIRTYLSFVPKKVLVPDFAPPNTISEYNFRLTEKNREQYVFIGPILDPAIHEVTPTRETVFASFGGESFNMPLYWMLKEISEINPRVTVQVCSPSEGLPEEGANFKIAGYVKNTFPYIARAKAAIIHGGLSTLHEAVYLGKPVLLIVDPNHPEEGNNGRKVEELGCGIMIRKDSVTKESLHEAICSCMEMEAADMRGLYEKEDGRVGFSRVLEEVVSANSRRTRKP
ncbi:MAG: glycosyl transferase family 28 [Methanocorpusculum parvum]|nr:glycosyl transferase family 28 [Methanocorpusculum parvum]